MAASAIEIALMLNPDRNLPLRFTAKSISIPAQAYHASGVVEYVHVPDQKWADGRRTCGTATTARLRA